MNTNSWCDNFKHLKKLHDDVFAAVDRAIKLEELEKPELAVNEYKNAVDLIDIGLNLVIESPDELDETWDEGCSIIEKLKGAKVEIMMRVEAITKKNPNLVNPFIKDENILALQSSKELIDALNYLKFSNITKAKNLELVFSTSNVKFYRICKSKEVNLLLNDATLRIVRMEINDDTNNGLTFMQIINTSDSTQIQNLEGESSDTLDDGTNQLNLDDIDEDNDPSWIYPLLPGISPCYQFEDGFFLFPDLEKNDGSALGVVVPDECKEILLEILVQLLQTVVKPHGIIETKDSVRTKRNLSTSISESMVKGAYYVSKGIVYSANKTSDLINYTTPYLISRIEKNPTNAQVVSPNVQKSVEIAQCVSTKAVSLTGFIANKVGLATTRLGKYLAPTIQHHGARILSNSFGMESEAANERVNDVMTVFAGAVQSFGTIYNGLEESSIILGSSLSDNTVKIVEHKYGDSAADLTKKSFDTVGNLINLNRNMKYITPKGLAKTTAKDTGKAVMLNYVPPNESSSSSFVNK